MTGATGYLGATLVPRLLARGHRALALARTGSSPRVAVVDVPGIRAA